MLIVTLSRSGVSREYLDSSVREHSTWMGACFLFSFFLLAAGSGRPGRGAGTATQRRQEAPAGHPGRRSPGGP
jgi:hypothetical protein